MFTGLIEEVGVLKSFSRNVDGARMVVSAGKISQELKIGDSVAVNGACSTVVSLTGNSFEVEYSNHTLELTTFANLLVGAKLNIERPLRLVDRLDGHIVTGHIDCKTKLLNVIKDGFSNKFVFELPSLYNNQIVKRGSIAIDGISLTVADCDEKAFVLEIIPHTIENTNLKSLKVGEYVNLETDITGKYIEKILLSKDNENKKSDIDMKFLSEKGFI